MFYNSAVFEKLSEIETGLYLESSAYIYELLKDDLQTAGLAGLFKEKCKKKR